MSLLPIATALAVLIAIGIIFVGARYLLAPQASARTFGLPEWPGEGANGWLRLKGVRDIVSGLIVLPALVLGEFQVMGWLLLVAAVTPAGDAIIVLRSGGSKALGYGMHGATAVVVLLIGVLLLIAA